MTLQRAQPDSVWFRGYRATGDDFRTIDENTKCNVNGDEGGTWQPSATLNVGGAGMVCSSPWSMDGVIGFGVVSSVDTDGDDAQVVFGRGARDDVFGYDSSQSYTLSAALYEHYALYNEQTKAVLNYNASASGVRTLAPGADFVVPLRVFNGGRITSLTLNWTVNETHANVPTRVPSMRAYAVDGAGTIFPLRAADGTSTNEDGFQAVTAAMTGTAYGASLANQTFTYVCNQNQVVDVSQYTYFVEIADESGSNVWSTTGNTFASVAVAIDSVLGFDGQN